MLSHLEIYFGSSPSPEVSQDFLHLVSNSSFNTHVVQLFMLCVWFVEGPPIVSDSILLSLVSLGRPCGVQLYRVPIAGAYHVLPFYWHYRRESPRQPLNSQGGSWTYIIYIYIYIYILYYIYNIIIYI